MGLFQPLTHHGAPRSDTHVPEAPVAPQGHSTHVRRVSDDAPVRSGRFTVHTSRDAYGAVSTSQRNAQPVAQQAAPQSASANWGWSATPAAPTAPVMVLAPQVVHVYGAPQRPAPPPVAPWRAAAPPIFTENCYAKPRYASPERSEAWSHSYDWRSGQSEEVYVRRTSGYGAFDMQPTQGPFAARRTRRTRSTTSALQPPILPLFQAVGSVVRGVWRATVWVAMLPVRLARALADALWALCAAVQSKLRGATA